MNQTDQQSPQVSLNPDEFDYSYVPNTARIAVYDDMKMPPHIIEILPAATSDFIEHLATCINDEKMKLGGKIPYSAIREVAENFIHAQFSEIVVSILDNGNTIRFCDQGPGIEDKEKVTLPGYTSAIEPMKHYILGVGSGLPRVKEYMDFTGGRITIEDNIKTGSVVTISLVKDQQSQATQAQVQQELTQTQTNTELTIPLPPLNEREKEALKYFYSEGTLGVTDLCKLQGLSNSSSFSLMKRMQEHGLIENTINKKRAITSYGRQVAEKLL